MNIHATPTKLTPAEIALVDAFAERISDLPGDATVTVQRDEAIERLKAGLPTRRIEAWHYTDLRRLLSIVPAFDSTAQAQGVAPLIEGSQLLRVLNGVADSIPSIESVRVERFHDVLQTGSGMSLAPVEHADAVGAINTAFASDGFALTIDADATLDTPIEFQNVQAGGQVHARFSVDAGSGSKAVVVERQLGTGDALASSVSTLTVGDGSDIVWIILQEQPTGATHLGQINVTLGKDSRLTLFVMNIGAKLVRQEVRVDAAGEGADFKLRGINLLGGDTHCDVTMVLDHSAPHTTSTEVIRNVVTDRAHGVFQGQIRVAAIAQKTDAKMACNTLLLSDDAEFSTKPELEIFADDVACGHGATVTEIDGNHLFYLMARGIEEKIARGLLVKAFVAEIIEEMDDEVIVEALEARLDGWFAEHG
ncbi:Fe-S cluster assembly protein SufD [Mesorhizobium sp. CAU 1732]|uniref:Fe-S cluster assembly protein SufD n=1 Tax=Mesorhizobium sp. CAU 1732 TaxID=3140358 RepID=UPI0032607EE4